MTGTGERASQPGDSGLVLVLNSGSSSVKFALVHPGSGQRVTDGLAERVGTPEAVLRIRRSSGDIVTERLADGSYRAIIARILGGLPEAGPGPAGNDQGRLIGVGHRVVHGGERFTRSVLVDDEVVAAIGSVSHLAPLHNPANLAGIEAVRAVRPDLPQVAVFDTAFHQTMPASAFRYAVPEEWYTRYGVRRFGFHGTSYRFVSERAAALLGRPTGRAAPGHRPPRQRMQRGGDTRRRLRRHHDGADPAGRAGHGDAFRRRGPRALRLPGGADRAERRRS